MSTSPAKKAIDSNRGKVAPFVTNQVSLHDHQLCQAGRLSGVCFCSHRCQIKSFIFTLFSMGLQWESSDNENTVKTHENDELNFHLKEWPRPGLSC